MIVQDSQLGAFGGTWETWCDQKYAGDPALIAKCKGQPFGPLTLPPWTDVGAAQRGLPKASIISTILNPGSGPIPSAPPPPTQDPNLPYDTGSSSVANLFGVPRTVLIVGAVILAVGVGAAVMSKRRRRRR